MASSSAYRYYADNGAVYQVILPDDFAPWLGYQSAVGTEPYLPANISPRYFTYVSPTGAAWRTAVVCTPSEFTVPPSAVTLSGIIYVFRSAIGEQQQSFLGGNVMTISGPQGPQGPTGATGATGPQGPQGTPGVANYLHAGMGSNVALSAGIASSLMTLTLTPGYWLITAQAIIKNGASAGYCALYLNPTGVQAGAIEKFIAVNVEDNMLVQGLAHVTVNTTLNVYAQATVAMTAEATGVSQAIGATNVVALQLQ